MSNRDSKNIDIDLKLALALSQTFNVPSFLHYLIEKNKESLDQQAFSVVKEFFQKILKSVEKNEVIKKKKFKALCNLIANLCDQENDDIPQNAIKKILQLIFHILNRKQYSFLDKDNIVLFQDLLILSVKLCTRLLHNYPKDGTIFTDKDKNKVFEDNCTLVYKILTLLLVPNKKGLPEISSKTILDNFENTPEITALQEKFAKNEGDKHFSEIFDLPLNIFEYLKNKEQDQILEAFREKLLLKQNLILDLVNTIEKFISYLHTRATSPQIKRDCLKLILNMKKSSEYEKRCIEVLENFLKVLSITEIQDLVADNSEDAFNTSTNKMQSLRIILVITENMFRAAQTLDTSTAAPSIANILLKLYKKFDFTTEDLQKIQSHLNFKETFAIFVETFHQIEIIANSTQETLDILPQLTSPKKSESKITDPSESLEESSSSSVSQELFKELKAEVQNRKHHVDSRTQASIKPFLSNKDTNETATPRIKVEDIQTLIQVFNNIFINILKSNESHSLLDFLDVFGVIAIHLRALNNLNKPSQKTLYNSFKDNFYKLVNECFQANSNYSPQFYGAFFDSVNLELSSDKQYSQLEYWFVVLRLTFLFGGSSHSQNTFAKDKIHKVGLNLLHKILANDPTCINYYLIVLSAIFNVISAEQKSSLMQGLIDDSLNKLQADAPQINLVQEILVLFYQLTCSHHNEFENYLREILFFDASTAELEKPLDLKWATEMISLRKSFFKDVAVPGWLKEENKAKLVNLAQLINQKITNNLEDFMLHPNLVALVIYFNMMISSFEKQNFATLPLINDFETLKKSINKTSRLTDIIEENAEVFESFEAYDQFDSYSKVQYLSQIFLKLISLTTKVSAPESQNSTTNENDIATQVQLWEDLLELLEKLEQKLTVNISNLIGECLNHSQKFSNVPGNELLKNFLFNTYLFSRYTHFPISPKLFGIAQDDVLYKLVTCLIDIKSFEQNVESKFENFYKLFHAGDLNTFTLELVSFCFLPDSQLRKGEAANNQLFELTKEIMVFSVLKQQIIRLFTALTKKIQENYGKPLPDDSLNRTFVTCAESLISSKSIPLEELPRLYHLFSFETDGAMKNTYFKLFIEMKKFSYLMKNLNIYTEIKNSNTLQDAQIVKLGSVLTKLFAQINTAELSNLNVKISFTLLFEISQNTFQMDKISPEFINWLRTAIGFDHLENTQLVSNFLDFSLSHYKPLSGIKSILDRGIQLKKNSLLPYLANKNSVNLLEIFSKLYTEPIPSSDEESKDAKDSGDMNNLIEDQPESNKGSKSGGDPFAQLFTKKSQKKSVNKTGRKKGESSSQKKSKDKESKQEPHELTPEKQNKLNALAAQLYEHIIKKILSHFNLQANLNNFEHCFYIRLLRSAVDLKSLKIEYENLMEVESDLKYEEIYLVLSQNDLGYLLDFIELLANIKLNQDPFKDQETVVTIINVTLKCLLQNLQKLYQEKEPSSLEIQNVAASFIYTLKKLNTILAKEQELLTKSTEINHIIYNLLSFICENNLQNDISSQVKNIQKILLIEINSFLSSLQSSKDPKSLGQNQQMSDIIEEENEQEDTEYCSFATTGAEHKTQHFYHCYTCNFVGSKGCCTVCARKCHQGHDVIYARSTRCYCDCGDGTGPSPCKCLKKPEKHAKKVSKEKKYADIDLKAKNPFPSNSFFSTFTGNVGQLEDFLRMNEDRRLLEKSPQGAKLYDEEDSGSSANEMEEEKLIDYSSDEDANSEEQSNLIFDQQRLKGIGSFFPQQTKVVSKSPGTKSNALLSNRLANKERERGDSMKIDTDDQSVSLGNIHEFLDERSVGSVPSLSSPRKTVPLDSQEVSKKLKEATTQKAFSEKFKQVMLQVQDSLAQKDIKFNYLDQVVLLLNQYCQTYASVTSSKEQALTMEEEAPVEVVQTYDFTKNLVVRPAQSLETKLTLPNKAFSAALDLKVRIINERNQMLALLLGSNPPFRKRLDFNSKNLIALSENDRVFFFDPSYFVSSNGPARKKSSIASLLKPFGGEPALPGSPFDRSAAVAKFTSTHPILSLCFNKNFPNIVALVGIESVTIITVEANGKINDVQVLNYHNEADFVLKALWVPGTKSALMLVSIKGIRVYDISLSLQEPILIFNALETYLKNAEVYPDQSSPQEFRIIATSADGQIYTQNFSLEGRTVENCDDLIMVETIMVPPEMKHMNGTASVSAFQSKLSNLFFSSWEDNTSLVSKFELERGPELVTGYRLNPAENREKVAAFPLLSKSGHLFSSFEDICVDESTYFGAAIIRKGTNSLDLNMNSFGIGVIMKVTKDTIQYQPILNALNINAFRIESFTAFDHPLKDKKAHYLLCVMEDGSLQVERVDPAEDDLNAPAAAEAKESSAKTAKTANVLTEIDALIKPSTLENSGIKAELVSSELLETKNSGFMTDFMEKSFVLDPSLLQFEEDMHKYHSAQSQIATKFGSQPASVAIPMPLDKNPLQFGFKLKSKDHVVYGVRVKLEVPSPLTIKVFERDVVLNQPEGEKVRFCDIIFSEEEIAYIYLAEKFKFSIQPFNKKINLKIYSIEVMGQTLDSFISQLKTNKLQTLKQKLASLNDPNAVEEIPIPSSLASKINPSALLASSTEKDDKTFWKLLDTLTMLLNIDSLDSLEINQAPLQELVDNLVHAIPQIGDHQLRKSAKKTLKVALKTFKVKSGMADSDNILGHKFDYYTRKDFAFLEHFNQLLLKKDDLTEAQISIIVRTLAKIKQKRPAQFLKFFAESPQLVHSLVKLLISLYKVSEASNSKNLQLPENLCFIPELLLLNYNYNKNKALHDKFGAIRESKLPEQARTDADVQNAGQPIVDLILELLFSVAKPYRNAILKILVKSLLNDNQAYIREKQSESALELSYSSNVYKNDHIVHAPVVPTEVKPDIMEVEGENLSEEDLYRLAIEMSLNQEREQQQQQQMQEIQSVKSPETQHETVFYFYRFDASEDLFKALLQKTSQITSTLEEHGIIFKLLYKILKMQQLVSYKAQTPINANFINSFAETVFNQLFKSRQDNLVNEKDAEAQKLLCYLNLSNICLLSKERKEDKNHKAAKKAPEQNLLLPEGQQEIQIETTKEEEKQQVETASLNRVLSIGKEFGNSFVRYFQAQEDNNQSISTWIFTTLTRLFEHFKSGKGTLYCTDNDTVLKKNLTLAKVSKADVEYYCQIWSPIFRKGDVSKLEGNLFAQIDQDVFIATVLFTCSLINLDFKISNLSAGWSELLSKLIIVPPTSQLATSFNKMLLKKFCGSREESYRIGDMVCFDMEVQEINKVSQETNQFNKLIQYNQLVTLTKSLLKIFNTAQSRPKNWSDYCINHNSNIVSVLHQLVLMNEDEVIELSFKLLAIYYLPQDKQSSVQKEKPEALTAAPVKDSSNILSEKPEKSKTTSSWLNITKEYIEKYVDEVLLNNYNNKIPTATLKMLISLWNVGNNSQRKELITKLISKLPQSFCFGNNSEYLFGLLSHVLKNTDWESSPNLIELRGQIINELINLLNGIKSRIASHPNHSLYTSLQDFLKDRSNTSIKYYLDDEVCFRCYEGIKIPFQDFRLKDLKEEEKYTSHCFLARLNNSYLINSVVVHLDERNAYRQIKTVKTINVYINNKPGVALVDLKNNWTEWKKLVSHTVDRKKQNEGGKLSVSINLPLPSTAKNIMVEFKTADLTKGLADSGYMVCPVCFKKFDNRFGNGRCLSCNESILECRKCGYLTEERIDSLFCGHCGTSRYINYEIILNAKIGYNTEKIDSEKGRETCEKTVKGLLEELSKSVKDVKDTRSKLQDLISYYHRSDEYQADKNAVRSFQGLLPTQIQEISHLYQKNARESFEKLMKTVGAIKSIRKTIYEYIVTNSLSKEEEEEVSKLATESNLFIEDSQRCYSCLQSTLSAYVSFFSEPSSILSVALPIVKHEPQFLYKLMDLSFNLTGVENNRKVLASVMSFLVVLLQQNDSSMIKNIMNDLDREIDQIIQKENRLTNVKEVKNIHYKMVMLISSNKGIQKIIAAKLKRNESQDLQLEVWNKTIEKMHNIAHLILDRQADNILLSEFVLGDILKFYKSYISMVDLKNEKQQSTLKPEVLPERIEEEKPAAEKEEFILDEENLDSIRVEIPDYIKEELSQQTQKAANTPFETYGLKLISQILLDDQKEPTSREKLLAEVHKKCESEEQLSIEDNWLVKCFAHSSNRIVSISQSIVKEITCPKTLPILFEIYYKSVSEVFNKEYKNETLFKSFKEFISSNIQKNTTLDFKFLKRALNSLFDLIESQLFKLEKNYSAHLGEASNLLIVRLNTGFEIYELLDIINNILKNNEKLLASLKNDKNVLQHVLKAFLLIRKFSNIKNHNILLCENLLREMFENLKPATEDDKKAYISECIGALLYYKNDNICQNFLYEQILNIIHPQKQRKDFLLQLTKAPHHEEYIRGQLSRTPYKASDLGAKMEDVRKRMCKELEIGDPNPYELMVANNLIDNDLPIDLVYEKVWVPFIRQKEEEGQSFGSEIPAMKVVMRIIGLDGEATENRVSGLVDDSEDAENVRQRATLTEVFDQELSISDNAQTKISGIEILLNKIKQLAYITIQKPLLKIVVKILVYCSRIQKNRTLVIKQKGIPTLLELLLHLFSQTEPEAESGEPDSLMENLLLILENVLRETIQGDMEIEKEIQVETSGDVKNNAKNIEMCLKRISHDAATPAHSKLLSSLTKILPFLTGNDPESSNILISFFSPYLKFSTFAQGNIFPGLQLMLQDSKEIKDPVRDYYLNKFIEMTEMLPAYLNVFREVLAKEQLIDKIINFIKLVNPDTNTLSLHSLEDNQKNLSYSMRIILGLINGDKDIQSALKSSGILDIIFKLSDPKIKLKEVGKYCEEIIECLLSAKSVIDPEVQNYIKELKQHELNEKKRKALQAREEALKKMGFNVNKQKAPSTDSMEVEQSNKDSEQKGSSLQYDLKQEIKNKFAMEGIEEEKVLTCISCQEGYKNKPEQILGIYTFTKKLRVPDTEMWIRGDPLAPTAQGFTTVTHFNCIHLHCHNAAAKADKQGKKSKQEWEGAIIRNSHTGCNGWFPIRGPKINDREYEVGLMKFHQTLNSVTSYDQDLTWLHICDLSNLFTRFAKYETFSKETKGGAAEHNLMFVPFYIQMLGHLLKQNGDRASLYSQRLEESITSFEKNNQNLNPNATFDEYMLLLTISLLFTNQAEWNEKAKLSLFYYSLHVATNILKSSRGQEVISHQIKNKVYLSPEFEGESEEENRMRLLDVLLPLMMGLRLNNELVGRLHSKCSPAESIETEETTLSKLENYITNNYEQVLVSCEEINKLYKEDFLQLKYFENFTKDINLYDKLIQDHGSIEQLIKTYLDKL